MGVKTMVSQRYVMENETETQLRATGNHRSNDAADDDSAAKPASTSSFEPDAIEIGKRDALHVAADQAAAGDGSNQAPPCPLQSFMRDLLRTTSTSSLPSDVTQEATQNGDKQERRRKARRRRRKLTRSESADELVFSPVRATRATAPSSNGLVLVTDNARSNSIRETVEERPFLRRHKSQPLDRCSSQHRPALLRRKKRDPSARHSYQHQHQHQHQPPQKHLDEQADRQQPKQRQSQWESQWQNQPRSKGPSQPQYLSSRIKSKSSADHRETRWQSTKTTAPIIPKRVGLMLPRRSDPTNCSSHGMQDEGRSAPLRSSSCDARTKTRRRRIRPTVCISINDGGNRSRNRSVDRAPTYTRRPSLTTSDVAPQDEEDRANDNGSTSRNAKEPGKTMHYLYSKNTLRRLDSM